VKAYKLLRLRKNGTLGSLYINRRAIIPLNQWIRAEKHPTKGYAVRPGWHCCERPVAPHLSMKGRVWAEVEIKNWYEFSRPKSQGGVWYIVDMMKVIRILGPQLPAWCSYYVPVDAKKRGKK
jgi:hypothetical protein